MGVMDKLKKILFDEEDVEVPVNSGEIPDRELRIVADKLEKKVASSKASTKKEEMPTRSFKDYHEYDDEDTIVELKVPAYEDEEEEEKTTSHPKTPEKRIKFPIDDFDDDIEEEEYIPKRVTHDDESKKSAPRSESSRIPKYVSDLRNEQHKEPREEKDYRKIIHDLDDENKRPFEVTPIISPVFGVLNKNYKQEEVDEKKALITQVNSGAKSRMYGPVSYNDSPLPRPPKFEPKKNGLKEELVELNSTISDLISDKTIDESDIEMPAKIVPDPVEEIDMPKYTQEEDDDDEVIATENYDDIPASIETPSKGHTNIEDAFESTSEFDEITEYDHSVEKHGIEEDLDEEELIEDEPEMQEDIISAYEDEEEVTLEEDTDEEEMASYEVEEEEEKVEKKPSKRRRPVEIEEILEQEENKEDDQLTDTIETDLFNLIDSMYKDDEEDSEDE